MKTTTNALVLGRAVDTTGPGTLLRFVVLGIAAAMFVVAPIASAQRTIGRRGSGGRYAFVNGLKMYYEVRGPQRGRPIVFLHGAFSNIESDFGKILPTIAKTRQVIAIEQQGHGRTADIDRPLTYEQMADDVAELLRQLRITNADFVGYSMGAASRCTSPFAIRSSCTSWCSRAEPATTRTASIPRCSRERRR